MCATMCKRQFVTVHTDIFFCCYARESSSRIFLRVIFCAIIPHSSQAADLKIFKVTKSVF